MNKYCIYLIVLVSLLQSCIEETDFSVVDPDNALDVLVVDAMLTDEIKTHTITLSTLDTILDLRTDTPFNPFEDLQGSDKDLVNYVEDAEVFVVSSTGENIRFNETSPGIYESEISFGALPNVSYNLSITANGKNYSSRAMKIEGSSQISDFYAERTTNDKGEEGIGIFVNSSIQNATTSNLRFNFLETFKIVAPNWTPLDFKLTDYDPCALPVPTYTLEIVDREEEQQVCYANVASNGIIQALQEDFQNTDEIRLMVNFLSKDNFKISHRYSIELSQMSVGIESYGFYDKLRLFSESDNILSQVQPGFIEGNIQADDGSTGTVIGFFDVASVEKQRLFFNYTDFYPDEPLPPYPFPCNIQSSRESHESYCNSGPSGGTTCPLSIVEKVAQGNISYIGTNDSDIGVCPGPYTYVDRFCGDCTALGSNVVPDFWIE
ncbi:DUF4249 family protein [uncultured Croceitalea sp.]|uniref:DUF4249 family protein n=1 Tax=uncultured Croceitalea sp. TaxID=1798908 RepID=UPI00330582D9